MKSPLGVALEVAKEAGALLLELQRRPLEIREKSRRADIVTLADGASERLVVERLRREYPNAAILTEESGLHAGRSQERWIIDPLDGTTNFAHGYPLWNVSIGYEREGELVAGVVYAPAMGECFAAEHGAGARLNDAAISVSRVARLGDALTCTGFHPANFSRNGRQFAVVSDHAQAVRRDGAAAIDLAYIACGRFDGFWEFDLPAWDVAAGILLVREAGGIVTRVDGGAYALGDDSILVTNGRIHEELARILGRSFDSGASPLRSG